MIACKIITFDIELFYRDHIFIVYFFS